MKRRGMRKSKRVSRKQRAGGLFNFFTKKNNTNVKKNNSNIKLYNNPLFRKSTNTGSNVMSVTSDLGSDTGSDPRSPISSTNSMNSFTQEPTTPRPITPVFGSRSVSPLPMKATFLEGNTTQKEKSINRFNNSTRLNIGVKYANEPETANVKMVPKLQRLPPSRRLLNSTRNVRPQVKTRKNRR